MTESAISTERIAELKQAARDFNQGLVFSDRHLAEHDTRLLPVVFMPLSLMDEKQSAAFEGAKPWLLYEYYSEALECRVSGYPCFGSFRIITQDEATLFRSYLTRLLAAPDPLADPAPAEEG